METENSPGSDSDVLVDLAATRRLFMQLIDVHRFGDWRIFLDGEEPDETDFTSYDPEKTPLNLWRGHAHLLFSNWLNYYVYQTTPFDLERL